MIKVISISISDYLLTLEFSDGVKGVADLSSHVTREPFLSLQDKIIFASAILEHGAVEWPKANVGIATEALHRLVRISNLL